MPAARHHVVTYLGQSASTFDLSVAFEVFGRDPDAGVPWYRFRIASTTPGPVLLDLGLELTVTAGLDAFRSADTIIVAGWSPATPPLVDALRAAQRRGCRMVSFCVGALVLAEAGVLHGRRATTHWHLHDRARALYPTVDIATDVLYIDDGDVLTSAGSTAALDLAVHIVRLDHGTRVANLVARNLVLPAHRGGDQTQLVAAPAANGITGDGTADTMDWMIAHLTEDLTLGVMARHANLSTRQFTRRFKEIAGVTPHRWLIRHRVLRARELLERPDFAIEQVARHSGFRSAAAMRPHFVRDVATSPTEYRRRFASRHDRVGRSERSGDGDL